jgi:hypothetical protein
LRIAQRIAHRWRVRSFEMPRRRFCTQPVHRQRLAVLRVFFCKRAVLFWRCKYLILRCLQAAHGATWPHSARWVAVGGAEARPAARARRRPVRDGRIGAARTWAAAAGWLAAHCWAVCGE